MESQRTDGSLRRGSGGARIHRSNVPGSSNGRTAASEAVYPGSNPGPGARELRHTVGVAQFSAGTGFEREGFGEREFPTYSGGESERGGSPSPKRVADDARHFLNNMPKPIAVFDIDGTLFRSALEAELNLAMVEYGLFPKIVKEELDTSFKAWVNRQGSYNDYLMKLVEVFEKRLAGISEEDVRIVSELVMRDQRDRVYVWPRDFIKKLRATHKLIAISGAPQIILDEFNKYWRFDYVYGTIFETKNGIFTGKQAVAPWRDKKRALLNCVKKNRLSLKKSIGVGDTEIDIPLLQTVEQPIAFNPNLALYQAAKKRGWEVIVERKNVIYEL
ncbi:MAG: hypothetical protein HW383_388 [Candidatus Magasanikbacteria bacterium]|nr:hypothetical protein [Candidatus Magasanikbacteria bacterium]